LNVSEATLEWLLHPSNTASRWLTLTLLLGKRDANRDVVEAKRGIPSSPWARKILEGQHPDGWWVDGKNLGEPKFNGTMFRLEALADIGMPGDNPKVKKACELFLNQAEISGEGFAPARYKNRRPHECGNGRMLFTFNTFGYGSDGRVKAAAKWLLANQMPDGGWNCGHEPKARLRPNGRIEMDHACSPEMKGHHSSFFTTMAVLKGLGTMAKPPSGAIKRGIEFLLQHRVYFAESTGRAVYGWPPALMFPPSLFYDGLQPLRVLAMLGTKYDPRLDKALDLLSSRPNRQGRWPLDRVPVRPNGDPRFSLVLDRIGKPNKWLTVQSLHVLEHFGRTTIPGRPGAPERRSHQSRQKRDEPEQVVAVDVATA
jgi:hypothetical protein